LLVGSRVRSEGSRDRGRRKDGDRWHIAWDAIHIWHETGRALLPSGEASRYEHWADFPSLKIRNESVQESARHYIIFDGQAAYELTNQNFEPRRELDSKMMRFGAYVACFGFFFPERFQASFRFDGTRTDHGVPYDVVRVAPTGLDPIDVWVDQRNHRIFRVAYSDGQHTDFSDYRTVGGVTVPFLSVDGGATARTDSIAFEPAGSISFSLACEQ
jgi:hypothetical protein